MGAGSRSTSTCSASVSADRQVAPGITRRTAAIGRRFVVGARPGDASGTGSVAPGLAGAAASALGFSQTVVPSLIASGVALLYDGTAVPMLVFIVAVKSPDVGALVRLVTVVIVPAVMLVGLAMLDGKVTPAAAVTAWVLIVSTSTFCVTAMVVPLKLTVVVGAAMSAQSRAFAPQSCPFLSRSHGSGPSDPVRYIIYGLILLN